MVNTKTKLFFDTEFTGLHKNTTLISIGIVSECGCKFYAELTDYDKTQIDEWLQINVINHLGINDNPFGMHVETTGKVSCQIKCNKEELKTELTRWLAQFKQVQMYSDCLAYDWVLFNDIFGTAFDIPKNVYYIPIDISTMLYAQGIDPDISREAYIAEQTGDWTPVTITGAKHNALYDAKVIQQVFSKLNSSNLYITDMPISDNLDDEVFNQLTPEEQQRVLDAEQQFKTHSNTNNEKDVSDLLIRDIFDSSTEQD